MKKDADNIYGRTVQYRELKHERSKKMKGFFEFVGFVTVILIVIGMFRENDSMSGSLPAVAEKVQAEMKGAVFAFDEQAGEIVLPDKVHKILRIPRGMTMSEIGRRAYADLQPLTNFGIGGTKFCYDMSAELSGFSNVNRIRAGDMLNLYSPGALGLECLNSMDRENLFSVVVHRDVTFLQGQTR